MLLFIESIIAYHYDRISIKKEGPFVYDFEKTASLLVFNQKWYIRYSTKLIKLSWNSWETSFQSFYRRNGKLCCDT